MKLARVVLYVPPQSNLPIVPVKLVGRLIVKYLFEDEVFEVAESPDVRGSSIPLVAFPTPTIAKSLVPLSYKKIRLMLGPFFAEIARYPS